MFAQFSVIDTILKSATPWKSVLDINFFLVLRMECTALHILQGLSTTELHLTWI